MGICRYMGCKMSNFKPLIGWTKWHNPYEINRCDDDKFDSKSNYNDDEENEQSIATPVKAILTPMGVVPLSEHSSPDKVFNLWTVHTNFDITHNILGIIEETPGIETVDVFTRYRMRVGIGKMFDTQEVIKTVNNNICTVLTSVSG